jgi:hypothetical protein
MLVKKVAKGDVPTVAWPVGPTQGKGRIDVF